MSLPPLAPLTPHIAEANSDALGFERALKIFHEAARRVPAYKNFLEKHNIRPEDIKTKSDFSQVPLVDKVNYISQYSLEDLSWDGVLDEAKCISTSSGSTGAPFYWPRGERQEQVTGMIFQYVYESIFGAKDHSTLCVDSFALGTWIAGLELYNATRWSTNQGSKIVIITPGIDQAEVLNQIKKLSRGFKRIILAGYPPFVKDSIESGTASGINWSTMDIRLLTGGEAFSETWRERVLHMIGKKPDDLESLIAMYGMAETGVVGHETPLSIHVRRLLRNMKISDPALPEYHDDIAIYQYYPTARYFEVADDHSLILTSDAGLPLVRYDTRDVGGIVSFETITSRIRSLLPTITEHVDISTWQLPFIYLYGRKDFSVSFYALKIYVENIKRALEHPTISHLVSGLSTMDVEHTSTLDQSLHIIIELSRGSTPNAALHKTISQVVVNTLREVNSEYNKLYTSIGERALPTIELVPYGKIDTIPGRKHKWIKRS